MELNRGEAGVIATEKSPHCKLRTVPVNRVKLSGFWKPRLKTNREKSLMTLYRLLDEHGVIDNFLIAAGKKEGKRRGPIFTDSDLYKWIETAAFILQSGPAPEISKTLNETIQIVRDAQEESGYLNTCFRGEKENERLKYFDRNHEFYCAGHLIQAAIAHYRATGKTPLLEVAIKFANFLTETFGYGKREDGYSGHPELEMAMVELYRTTGNKQYLDFAKYLLDKHNFSQLREMDPKKNLSTGHAVRATYLCSGAADYYAETGDAKTWKALESLWQDVAMQKMYITGGIGSRYEGESFGWAYELPNLRAYAETCAAIGNIFWNWRMLCITGEARFADVMERALYNGFLSGVSLDGTKYFYVNPLTSLGGNAKGWYAPERQPWFDCTCCPPNVQRMLASLPGYFFTASSEGIWVHLYGESTLDWHFQDGCNFELFQKTNYPRDGKIEMTINLDSPKKFALFLRIPGWCEKARIAINGKTLDRTIKPGSYLELQRQWKNNDRVNIEFAMPVVLMDAHPRVESTRCAVAIQRGPVVYCIESVDNPGVPALDINLIGKKFSVKLEPNLLGGVVTIKGKVGFWKGEKLDKPLYLPLARRKSGQILKKEARFIPYYAWANRGKSQMQVWVPLKKR